MDSAISFDAPFRLDFLSCPRWAASAAPAAICCFFDLAGILFNRRAGKKRMYSLDSKRTLLFNPNPETKAFRSAFLERFLDRSDNKYILVQFNVEKQLAKQFR